MEVLKIADSHRLMVAPCILVALALLLGTNSVFPAVGIPETVATAVSHTSARETHKLGMQVSQRLCQVGTHAVTLESLLGIERNIVDVVLALCQRQYHQRRLVAVVIYLDGAGVFFPLVAAHLDCSLANRLGVLSPTLCGCGEDDAEVLVLAVGIAEEHRKVVLSTLLDADAVETVVLQANALPAFVVVEFLHALCKDVHVVRVVGMDGILLAHFHIAERMTRTRKFPRRASSPAVALDGAVLKRAVLYEFGAEAAVS